MGNILPRNACYFFFSGRFHRFIRCWIRCSMFILPGHLSSLQLLCLKMIVLLLGDECKSTFNTTVLPFFFFPHQTSSIRKISLLTRHRHHRQFWDDQGPWPALTVTSKTTSWSDKFGTILEPVRAMRLVDMLSLLLNSWLESNPWYPVHSSWVIKALLHTHEKSSQNDGQMITFQVIFSIIQWLFYLFNGYTNNCPSPQNSNYITILLILILLVTLLFIL